MAQTRLVLAVTAGALTVLLAGCSEPRGGTPQAGANQTSNERTSAAQPTTRSTSASAGAKDPCALLTSNEASGLGYGTGKPKNVAGLKACDWVASSGTGGIMIGFGENSLDALKGQSVEIGKHKAAKLPKTIFGEGCAIGLGLPDSTSVIVVGTPPVGQPDDSVCPKTTEAAKIIDPKLP